MKTMPLLALAATLTGVLACHSAGGNGTPTGSDGVSVRSEDMARRHGELTARVTAAPDRVMTRCGLAGVVGGVHLRVSSVDPQDVLLPIPQVIDGQVPLCFYLVADPPAALAGLRLRTREVGNVVAGVRLSGGKREVRVAWSAVVLLAPKPVTPDATPAGPYLADSPCVQSESDEIARLAAETWPASGKPAEFAAAVQRLVAGSKRRERPRSLDALGILKSGENGICTANANLAAALMRSKGIACRTVAVVPTVSHKLEMHRVAEYFDGDRWVVFDPSSLSPDVPCKPWQNVVVAKTTPADEAVSMKPRRGAMVGCPYGQEAEMLTGGVDLYGQDFFWTLAKPLAEFDPTEETARAAADAWKRYLETGELAGAQVRAASAQSAAELAAAFRRE